MPFGIPDWSAERVLFFKVFMQVCLRTNDILQNFTFYRSRKELENVEFRKRQLDKAVLSARFRPPRSKRVARPARSELLAPPEASCSPCSKRVTRPARSELHASLEASCSPRPKRVARPARSELHALPEASCSPCSGAASTPRARCTI